MTPTEAPTGPAALVTRSLADAQVFRRYGATGRARMLEQIAAEFELSTTDEAAAVVGMRVAVALTGFTRGYLRRLYREGRLVAAKWLSGAETWIEGGRIGGIEAGWGAAAREEIRGVAARTFSGGLAVSAERRGRGDAGQGSGPRAARRG